LVPGGRSSTPVSEPINVAARRRYEHEGFVATGRTQSLPSDETIAELEMTLDLR
jgi:hypothetical protein